MTDKKEAADTDEGPLLEAEITNTRTAGDKKPYTVH
jgi:hypothetical protein